MKLTWWICVAATAVGCTAPSSVSDVPPLPRPYDSGNSRIQWMGGDRIDDLLGEVGPVGVRSKPEGDWSYDVDGPVNGGPAIYTGLARACSDRLFVPTDRNATNNFYAFDNLASTDALGAACPNTTGDGRCSPSPNNHCPRRIWRVSLNGNMKRNSVALDLNGTRAYVLTSTGRVYSLDTATGANYSFNAQTDTGSATATFIGQSPWVEYFPGGILYLAASYGTGTGARIRLYKLLDTGAALTKLAHLDIGSAALPERIESSTIVWNGFIYLGTTGGRVYKIQDGVTLTQVASPWPLQLQARGSAGFESGHPIYGSPSIDAANDLLFVIVNNVGWSVKLGTGATDWVEMGWTNETEAAANNVPCYSSPFVTPSLRTFFAAHGKNQNTPASQRSRMHRRIYAASGVFDTASLTSVATAGASSDLSYPRSSPLVFRPTAASPLYVYVGDPGGYLNRWSYGTDFSNQVTFGPINNNNPSIDSAIMIDGVSGNIYFGDATDRIYQIGQVSLQ